MVAIAPEPADKLGEMARKVADETSGPVSIVFLADTEHRVISAYGLLNEAAVERKRFLPHPTTYVLDADGIVRWKFTEVDYKLRPSSQAVLLEVQKLLVR